MAQVLRPFVPLFLGSSLTTGRLAADWVPRLQAELLDQPEAIGPYHIINAGKGSQNSAWGVTQIDLVCAYKPTHILMEGFAINDCIDFGGGPAISQAGHIANINTMVAAFQAQIPGVDITIQTMNPVSTAGAGIRPNLAAYYADEIIRAAALGVHSLDNYTRWVAGLGSLPDWLSNEFDGLHPLYTGAVDTYLYPYVLLWARQKMAAMWALANPTVPVLPAATDCDVLMVGGGGAGGDQGGGGGAGRVRRFRARWADIVGSVVIGAAGAPAGSAPGGNGGDTTLGGKTAKGGGGGGNYTGAPTNLGKDGGCGGGGGPSTAVGAHAGGAGLFDPANHGGQSSATPDQGGGGGGGCAGPGLDGTVDGGQGGPGWLSDVPGDAQDMGAGGPGATVAAGGAQPAYLAGAGPGKWGGGGKGGMGGIGEAGGLGVAYVWYDTVGGRTGGVKTVVGGKTVHKITANDTLAG
jgi:hypothetical protein